MTLSENIMLKWQEHKTPLNALFELNHPHIASRGERHVFGHSWSGVQVVSIRQVWSQDRAVAEWNISLTAGCYPYRLVASTMRADEEGGVVRFTLPDGSYLCLYD